MAKKKENKLRSEILGQQVSRIEVTIVPEPGKKMAPMDLILYIARARQHDNEVGHRGKKAKKKEQHRQKNK